jgi:hypothetical protein
MNNLTQQEREAIAVIAHLVDRTGAYDYVDDTIEIRLYGAARDCFSTALSTNISKAHPTS